MKTIIVVIICMTVLIGCGDSAISPPSSVQSYEYYPLQIGNSWRYKVSNSEASGNVYKLTVESTETINGKTYFKISDSSENYERGVLYRYERIEDSKLYTYDIYGEKKDVLSIDFVRRDTTVGYVISITDNVSSSIGTFNNVKNVVWTASSYDAAPYDSYAPNVGMLKSVMRGHRVELISAKIGDKVYP